MGRYEPLYNENPAGGARGTDNRPVTMYDPPEQGQTATLRPVLNKQANTGDTVTGMGSGNSEVIYNADGKCGLPQDWGLAPTRSSR